MKIFLSILQKRNTLAFILVFLCSVLQVSAQVVPVLKYVSVMEGTNMTTEDFTMDAAGNTYTIGWMWGTVDFDPGPGTYNLSSVGGFDAFVAKMGPTGNLVWARIFGGSNYEHGYGIAVDASGNVYTTGRHVGTTDFDPGVGTYNLNGGSPYSNIFISKLNSTGDFVWALSIGGGTEDLGESIAVDASGNVHVLGTFSNTVDFDPGTGSFNLGGNNAATFILKLTTNGTFIWAKTFATTYQTYPTAITLDGSGNVYTTGSWYADPMDFDPGAGTYFLTPVASSTEMFISKLNANGDFVWAKSIGNQYTENGDDIELDNSGNVLVTGKYVSTVDFDPGSGISNMTSAEGTGDIFILKLANDGTYLWSKTMGGVGYTTFSGNENRGFAITSDLTGNVFVTGRFSSSGDFDPGPGVVTLDANSTSHTDMFISKFNAAGNLIWATDLGSANSYDFGSGIRTDAAGAVYIGGQSQGAVDFDPSACVFNAGSGWSAFVLKLSEAPPIPAPTITSFSPTFGPIGTPVTITGTNFSAVAAENGVTFFNNKPAVVTGSSLTTINTSVPATSTSGVIKVTVACVTVTSTAVFTVGASPVITINPQPVNAAVCLGNTATFTTGASGTTNIAYQWQFSTSSTGTYTDIGNTGGYSNTNTATLSVNTTGSFGAGFYKCKISGDLATTVLTTFARLTITSLPATPTGSSASRCGPGALTLTAAGGSTGQYRWYTVPTGGTSIPGQTNASYSPTVTVTTPYYVAVNNGTCESNRRTLTAVVSTPPAAPSVSDSHVCDYGSGGTAYLYASGGSFYQWYTVPTGGTPIPGETDYVYAPTVTSATTFYVSIVNGACEGPRSPVVIEFFIAPPKPTATSNKPLVNNEITACPGEVILSGPPGYGGYLWYPVEDGGEHWVVRESGAYTVRVYDEVTGCESEDSDEVNVIIDETNCVNTPPAITLEPVSILINGKVTLDLMPTLSDQENNLDLETLSIVEQPQSGAEATITDGILEVDYASVQFSGTDRLRIGVCDYFGECAEQELEITVIGDIVVYNGISPNKDEANDVWFIQNIDAIDETKNNKVSIFNRWGDEVFSVDNYNNADRVFKGLGKSGNELPSGTYFYKIEFVTGRTAQTGYLTLKK